MKRTAIEALKQCGSAWLPDIIPPVSLEEYLSTAPRVDLPLLASLQPGALNLHNCVARFCESHQSAPRSASLWIGPEGDFSPAEIARIQTEAGALPISLGPWVLPTETAAIAGLVILNHELTVKKFYRFCRVGNPHHHHPLLGVWRGGTIAILDIDLGICQLVSNAREFSRAIAPIQDQDVVFHHQGAVRLKHVDGFPVITNHQPHHAGIHRVLSPPLQPQPFGEK